MSTVLIPSGKMKSEDEDAAAKKRREIKEKLLRGEQVKITPAGTVTDAKDSRETGIIVPPGKLASFYWYERDPALLDSEKEAMKRFFPQFHLGALDDGRLYWYGKMTTNLRKGGHWHLQAVYDNNHPDNSAYGGSIKVYSIDPDLHEIMAELDEPIPHLLKDSSGNAYLCTARKEDVYAGSKVTSAASCLSWAAKWIAAFELWMAGDLSTDEFSGHDI